MSSLGVCRKKKPCSTKDVSASACCVQTVMLLLLLLDYFLLMRPHSDFCHKSEVVFHLAECDRQDVEKGKPTWSPVYVGNRVDASLQLVINAKLMICGAKHHTDKNIKWRGEVDILSVGGQLTNLLLSKSVKIKWWIYRFYKEKVKYFTLMDYRLYCVWYPALFSH